MPYSPINRIQYGGSSSTSPAWYGDGRDGTLSTSGNVTLLAANGDSTSTIMQYESLTVNSGHTLSAGFRTRALVIYVRGSAVINGSITMGNGAAAAASVINLTRYDVNGLTGTSCEPANTVNFTTPKFYGSDFAPITAGTIGINVNDATFVDQVMIHTSANAPIFSPVNVVVSGPYFENDNNTIVFRKLSPTQIQVFINQ